MSDEALSLVLFSGTDDKLTAASVLVVGAAAMGRPVHVLLQYWALDAFRTGHTRKNHGAVPEAGVEGAELLRAAGERGQQHWADLLEQAKALGNVDLQACSLSMDLFGLTREDLDPLVDGVQGVAAFMATASGPITFV